MEAGLSESLEKVLALGIWGSNLKFGCVSAGSVLGQECSLGYWILSLQDPVYIRAGLKRGKYNKMSETEVLGRTNIDFLTPLVAGKPKIKAESSSVVW